MSSSRSSTAASAASPDRGLPDWGRVGSGMKLRDKVAIVTGGAQGIGRAIVEGLAAEGASVVIADLQGADGPAKALRGQGRRALEVACDVSDEGQVAAMAQAAVRAFGGIDILVNNAGIYSSLVPKPFEEITAG